jgi:hypothetical protein
MRRLAVTFASTVLVALWASMALAGDFKGCPVEGIQTNPHRAAKPKLNSLKNREEVPSSYEHLTVAEFLERTEAVGDINSPENADITAEALAVVTPLIEKAVRIEGYLVGVKRGSVESANCGGKAGYDFHVWLSDEPGEDQDHISVDELRGYKSTAIVVEPTPRWIAKNEGWKSITPYKRLIKHQTRVRIGGWVFYDPEHPEEVEQTRATLWEIHPVTKIEYFSGGKWKVLTTKATQPPQ